MVYIDHDYRWLAIICMYRLFWTKKKHMLSKVHGWDASRCEKLLPGHGLIILIFRNFKPKRQKPKPDTFNSKLNQYFTSLTSHHPWLHPVVWTLVTIRIGGLSISYHEIRSIRKNAITVIEKKQAQIAQKEQMWVSHSLCPPFHISKRKQTKMV